MSEPTNEPINQFEGRKKDHLELALKNENEAIGGSGLEQVSLVHEALPEIDFSQVSLATTILQQNSKTPFLLSSMTAGHAGSVNLNLRFALACEARGWWMGVGSQRRELFDADAAKEWKKVRQAAPKVKLLGNIGLSQLIRSSNDDIKKLVDNLEAGGLIVHLNPLQECMQPEGTPNFRGGLTRISELVQQLAQPVIVKETGCGMSENTLRRLNETGVAAVDVSGFGGTHWGRIEGRRSQGGSLLSEAAGTFNNWGISTVESMRYTIKVQPKYEVWASGGVRSGLDAAKLLAMGAACVGFAKPMLQAALESDEKLQKRMELIEYELRTALFCTGCLTVGELATKGVWNWRQKA